MTILVFLLVLTLLVLIHELGHFWVAKKLGIKVEEFGVGFPPRVFGKKIGETIYSINWLPIGGFVKLYGEDATGGGKLKVKQSLRADALKSEMSKISKRAFFARPPWQKALVAIAGVFMNFVLAVFLMSFLFSFVGVATPGDKVIINQIAPNSPAEKAGLKKGDVIQSIDGIKITSTRQLIEETKKHLGEEISLRLRSGQALKEVKVTPRKDFPKDQGPIGVAISQGFEVKKYPWYQAPFVGTAQALQLSWLIISGLGTVLYQLITTGLVPRDVAGPVGIAQLTGFFCANLNSCLSFTALLSLNLAILNILPIPALDGGRLFFILIELLTGRRVHPRFESYAHAIGMAILLTLVALITLQDLTRLLSGQSLLPKP